MIKGTKWWQRFAAPAVEQVAHVHELDLVRVRRQEVYEIAIGDRGDQILERLGLRGRRIGDRAGNDVAGDAVDDVCDPVVLDALERALGLDEHRDVVDGRGPGCLRGTGAVEVRPDHPVLDLVERMACAVRQYSECPVGHVGRNGFVDLALDGESRRDVVAAGGNGERLADLH